MSQQINLYESRLRPRRELATGRNLGLAGLILLVLVAGTSAWVGTEAARKAEAAAALQKQLGEQQEQLTALSKAVAAEEWKAGGAALGRIRQLVGTNLTLGFLTIAMGTLGRWLG